jgi:hypothetical protein
VVGIVVTVVIAVTEVSVEIAKSALQSHASVNSAEQARVFAPTQI